jgi:hypothetical protein
VFSGAGGAPDPRQCLGLHHTYRVISRSYIRQLTYTALQHPDGQLAGRGDPLPQKQAQTLIQSPDKELK